MAYRNLYAGPDARGESSAVSSVLYAAHGQSSLQETRNGSYIFDGNPSNFPGWVFRVSLKIYKGRDKEKYVESMSRVMDGLKGIVFVVAQEIGLAALMRPSDPLPSAGGTTTSDDDEDEPDLSSFGDSPNAAPDGAVDAGQALRVPRPLGLDALIAAVKTTVPADDTRSKGVVSVILQV